MGSVRQLVNAQGAWGGQPGWANPTGALLGTNDQVLMTAVNNSGGTLTHGDVVVIDTSASVFPAVATPPVTPQSGGYAVTTTTTAKDPKTVGVVSITGDASTNAVVVQPGQTVMVCIAGVARVNCASGVAAGNFLQAGATAKQAVGNGALAAGDIGTTFGVALEAYAARDANNTIRALIQNA